LDFIEIVVYLAISALFGFSLFQRLRDWKKVRENAEADLKTNFFPKLRINLNELDQLLSNEEVSSAGYVALLNRGWKSTFLLDLHVHFLREEEMFNELKQSLVYYELEVNEWTKTKDLKLKEKLIHKKEKIREKIVKLNRKLNGLNYPS